MFRFKCHCGYSTTDYEQFNIHQSGCVPKKHKLCELKETVSGLRCYGEYVGEYEEFACYDRNLYVQFDRYVMDIYDGFSMLIPKEVILSLAEELKKERRNDLDE